MPGGADGIRALLEVLEREAGDERDPVLGEDVGDEDQVADAPGDDLPPDPEIERGELDIDVAFPQLCVDLAPDGVVDQLGLGKKRPAVPAGGQLEPRPPLAEDEVLGAREPLGAGTGIGPDQPVGRRGLDKAVDGQRLLRRGGDPRDGEEPREDDEAALQRTSSAGGARNARSLKRSGASFWL